MTDAKYDKFKKLLAELFMLDQADLDFGIYRIMNAKRDEISRFLDHDLLPQVEQSLTTLDIGNRSAIEAELGKAVEAAKHLGVPPESSPIVQRLRDQLADTLNISEVKSEIFSSLYSFFSRYYDSGDFISKRRYKPGIYAIPYEGEEIKLHWANNDQYYIKTSEYLRDYAFRLSDGRRVLFKIVSASTELNNNRTATGNNRHFVLAENDPVIVEEGELIVRFEYKQDSVKKATSEPTEATTQSGKKATQESRNAEAAKKILSNPVALHWVSALSAPSKNPEKTILERYLSDYTARNTFDYFIHKDLRTFLRRELDFFIKNEIVHLDDIENQSANAINHYVCKLRAVRKIASKIIDFVAQIENFQRKLWLKKKFVVETNYCVSIDRVPQELLPLIAANERQHEEWIQLFAIDKIEGDLSHPGYSVPLTVEFLKAHQNLIVDTVFFDAATRDLILSGIMDLDRQMTGLLVRSENFQALQLLRPRYRNSIKCIYIDPPYNTASSSIPYKNDYRHSSWATMMNDRIASIKPLLRDDGALFVSIDKTERNVLDYVLDGTFGRDNKIEELIWSMNTTNSQAPNYSTNHEYVEVYARDRVRAEQDPDMFREPKPGFTQVMELVASLNPSFPPIKEIEGAIRRLYEQHRIEYRDEVESQGLDWEDEKNNDPWRGLFNYSKAEYRDSSGRRVLENEANQQDAKIWVWQEGDASMPATKQADSTRDPNHPNWRFYKPPHPVTGNPCPHPKSGWKFAYNDDEDSPDRRSFVSLDRDHRIAWGEDEKKVPRIKRMLHEVETNIGKSVFQDYSDGEKQTSAMFGKSGVFLAPKHSDFVSRFIMHSAKKDSAILDCFGGSGSTAHAVIKLNHDDGGSRKFILIEVGSHFDTVLKPRVLKAAYSTAWKSGKPIGRDGKSHLIKYIRLESYEDALNNLAFTPRTSAQQSLLESSEAIREQYILRYMLDIESVGSSSLLNIDTFVDPFNYQMQISTGIVGETQLVAVDLVETFNYLLGLRVQRVSTKNGIRVIVGVNAAGDNVLVLWRNSDTISNSELETIFVREAYSDPAQNLKQIYVNGDNTLQSVRPDGACWEVRMIEKEFKRLMFEMVEA